MKFRLLIFFFLISCVQETANLKFKSPFTSKGFAYIYNDNDYNNKIIKKKLDNNTLQIAHNKLRSGSLIKIINPKTKDFIILKNTKKINYPEFYKILITDSVAKKINLYSDFPFVEIIEIKKNKSFIAKKTKIFNEEKKIFSNAPVQSVKIDNISTNKLNIKKTYRDKIYIIVGNFYSKETALMLKNRITKELIRYNSKKMYIKSKKTNKFTLLSGPYNSINLMKNDYIQLKNFGFEELDISINE